MIYLDYSSTTPVDKEVLNEYVNTSLLFIGNSNSIHKLGKLSKIKMQESINSIAKRFKCLPSELIFTSGASESNAYAIRGVAETFKVYGRHIITSKLEHKSILEEMKRLKSKNFEIEYVNILNNGQIDLEDLKNKIREDTILISICGVNSEVGYIQDLNAIRKIINLKNKKVIFHSDMTQALGKIKIDLVPLDLASFSSHKIYAPKGLGILYQKKELLIDKLICGTTSNAPYRGGTPDVASICAFDLALEKSISDLDRNIEKCKYLNNLLRQGLQKYNIQINSNELCIPQVLNISLLNRNNVDFLHELEKEDIYVSTTTACSSKEESIILKEIYKDSKVSTTSLRISISHLTTEDEIIKFLEVFDKIYNNN